MDIGIGETFRETRNRRKVGLAEVEAATKIRVRFLRAMENEEWDALPGGAYTRGFIRTYASYLGLDGERLAEEYRRATASPGGTRAPRVEPAATGSGGAERNAWFRGRTMVAVIVAGLLVTAVAIGLLGGGEGNVTKDTRSNGVTTARRSHVPGAEKRQASGVAVQLTAQAEVWVCLLDSSGKTLIDGQILQRGAEEGPFRAGGFSVSFGNGEVTMLVDGREAEVPPSSSPLGYRIDSSGHLTQLEESERPTCT